MVCDTVDSVAVIFGPSLLPPLSNYSCHVPKHSPTGRETIRLDWFKMHVYDIHLYWFLKPFSSTLLRGHICAKCSHAFSPTTQNAAPSFQLFRHFVKRVHIHSRKTNVFSLCENLPILSNVSS